MVLRDIEVWNFLNHEHEHLSLPASGFFFLDGASGFGKSSLFIDAPLFALFGYRATRAGQKGMTMNDLRHKRHQSERMAVRVIYEFETGELMVVERGVDEKNASYAVLEENWREPDGSYRWETNKQVALGAAPVERAVRIKLGGMSWQQLTAAFVARQKEIAQLSEKTGKEREQLVHRLLGVRELELAEKEMAVRKKRAEDELKLVVAQIGSRSREGELARIAELRTALADATFRAEAIETELQTLRTRQAALEAEIAPLQVALQAQGEIERLQAALAARTVEIETLAEKASRHLAAAELVQALADLPARLRAAEEGRAKLLEGYQRLQQAEKLQVELVGAEARLSQVRELVTVGGSPSVLTAAPELSVAEIDQRLAAITAEKKHLKTDGEQRSGELARMREEGACFTCGRPLDDGHDHSDVLDGLTAKLEQLRADYADLTEEEHGLNEQIPAARARDSARAEQEREIIRAEEALRGLKSRLDALDVSELPSQEEILEQGKAAKLEIDALQAQRIELGVAEHDLDPQAAPLLQAKQANQSADELKLTSARAAAEIVVDRAKLAELEGTLSAVASDVSRREGQLPELQTAQTRSASELANAEAEYQQFGALLEEKETRSAQSNDYKFLAAVLKAFTKSLAEEIRPSLEEMASEMLYHITNGAFTKIMIADNYELSLLDDEGEITKLQGLSGGEDVRANLALRLALTRLVSQRTGVPVGFLILDEPFINLDQGHVESALEVLGALKPFYPQAFIISHVGDLASSQHIDYRIAVESRKGSDRVKLYQR